MTDHIGGDEYHVGKQIVVLVDPDQFRVFGQVLDLVQISVDVAWVHEPAEVGEPVAVVDR